VSRQQIYFWGAAEGRRRTYFLHTFKSFAEGKSSPRGDNQKADLDYLSIYYKLRCQKVERGLYQGRSARFQAPYLRPG
jgi:hypothetical protein